METAGERGRSEERHLSIVLSAEDMFDFSFKI